MTTWTRALEIVADQRTKGYTAWIEDEHGIRRVRMDRDRSGYRPRSDIHRRTYPNALARRETTWCRGYAAWN